MSFSLSSIVSDISSLATDPGKLAKDVCDAVLPQNMKAIGDIVGGAVDYETGHPLQALGHLADALKDLPQMAQGLSPAKGNLTAAPVGSLAAEPAPPPPRAPAAQTTAANVAASLGGSASPSTSTSASPPSSGGSGTQVSVTVDTNGRNSAVRERSDARSSEGTYRAPTRDGGYHATTSGRGHRQAGRAHGGRAASTGSTTVTVNAANASAPAATPSATAGSSTNATSKAPSAGTGGAGPTSGTPPSSTSSSSAGASSTDASSTSGSTASTSGSKGAGSTAPSSLSDLMALSPDQFMQAVTSGKIPADVANNPSAMTQIQARMNQITQMNQLVTSMMAAMHQMQMSIIQNIRV